MKVDIKFILKIAKQEKMDVIDVLNLYLRCNGNFEKVEKIIKLKNAIIIKQDEFLKTNFMFEDFYWK